MKASKAQTYYRLTKPGIVYGNAFTAIAGYVLGARDGFSFTRFVGTILAICLVIASACVLNNLLDRRIDARMTRTRNRATVTGAIPPYAALAYAAVLGITGLTLLALSANGLSVLLGLIAVLVYVVLYGAAKRYSGFGTAVGSIAGALPPVAGYTAALGRFDGGAGLLLLLLVVWQMPHFYAIEIYRRAEYKAAGIPLLSVRKGALATRRRIVLYLVLFLLVAALPTVFHYTGLIYAILAVALAAGWLVTALRHYKDADLNAWARRVFRYSLAIVLAMPVLIAIGRFLP